MSLGRQHRGPGIIPEGSAPAASRPVSPRRTHARERGSALLIVFVFAAMVAIMLYKEMPVAAFEAQREKEQLLIDRGNEYKHAIKLYVRKVGTFPSSLDQLENTNRMRFLRHRFTDPFTGKDNWRLIHAGPGGMILDSKVNPVSNPSQAGVNGTANATGFGSNSRGFGASTTGPTPTTPAFSQSSDSTPGEVVVPAIAQRPPAIPANGSGGAAQNAAENPDPTAPLLAPGQAEQMTSNAPEANQGGSETAAVNQQAQAQAGAGQTGATANAVQAGVIPGQNTTQTAGAQAPSIPGAAAGANPADPKQTMQNLLSNTNPRTTAQQPATTATSNRTIGGGVAGVASKAAGHSIKLVNDQSNYSMWEFYYDMAKEMNSAMPGGMQQGVVRQGTVTGSQSSAQSSQWFNQSSQNTTNPSASTGTAITASPTTGSPATNSAANPFATNPSANPSQAYPQNSPQNQPQN